MIIDCISDLHGFTPKLQGGDLLLIAGDLTARDEPYEFEEFKQWLKNQPYTKKVLIAGNHDNFLAFHENPRAYFEDAIYLCDSGIEINGFKIWGTPWTKNFVGQNPRCKAFGLNFETQLLERFELIPDNIDILITHSPPEGILDKTWSSHARAGSPSLKSRVLKMPELKLHLFGHIHEGYGTQEGPLKATFVNASFVNKYYHPVHHAIRIIL